MSERTPDRRELNGLFTRAEADTELVRLNGHHETETHAFVGEIATNYGTPLYRLVYREKPEAEAA